MCGTMSQSLEPLTTKGETKSGANQPGNQLGSLEGLKPKVVHVGNEELGAKGGKPRKIGKEVEWGSTIPFLSLKLGQPIQRLAW